MPGVGYLPFAPTAVSVEAGWLADHLSTEVRVVAAPCLNLVPGEPLPTLDTLQPALDDLRELPAVVAEGPGGFLWAALLRAQGFAGTVAVLPYLNPRRWHDVAATALYRRFARPSDRVFLGSAPSAAVYRSLGVEARVGEPFGVDDSRFGLRPGAGRVRQQLALPAGRLLLFAGRAQPDKDLYRLLRAGLKARLLFPDLQVVVATHVADADYLAPVAADGVHLVVDPSPDQLADLYNVADVFVTASTSHFETFGRAPAEALCCGTPAVAPRYDGFAEVLDQPGGTLVDVEIDRLTGMPHVNEAMLLSVYDVLSDARPPRRAEISATARRRFGRSNTLHLLGHLGGGTDVTPAPTAVASASVGIPPRWLPALAEIAARRPSDAISFLWDGCDHDRLGEADAEFVAEVRRALCVAVQDEELRACR